jgi:hypothetical protein
VVVIEVHMHARHDVPLEVVLDMREFAREITHMVVVHEGDGRDRIFVLVPFLPDKIVADEVTQRFGPIRVFAAPDVPIEIVEQVMIERDAETDQLFHKHTSLVARIEHK